MEEKLKHSEHTVHYLSSLANDRQSGEVLFQYGEQSAKVYLQEGLIVWAFAAGQEESFQSILIRENNFTKEELLSGIRDARQNGQKSLNEILKALGIEQDEVRTKIIERHTRAALKVITNWGTCSAQFNALDKTTNGDGGGLELSTLVDLPHPKLASQGDDAQLPDLPRPCFWSQCSSPGHF